MVGSLEYFPRLKSEHETASKSEAELSSRRQLCQSCKCESVMCESSEYQLTGLDGHTGSPISERGGKAKAMWVKCAAARSGDRAVMNKDSGGGLLNGRRYWVMDEGV